VRDHGAVARAKRGNETVADMARSLGLVLGSVVLILLIGPTRELIFPTGPHGTAVKTVDISRQVAAAREAAAYPVLAPRGLSARWRPTSARITVAPSAGGSSATLHLGYVTPRARYLALEEGDATGFVADQLGRGPRPLPTVEIGGSPWQQWRTASGELALTRTAQGRSVVLTGSAALDELRELAGSLATG
jgi:hypothetical protein